MSPLPLCALLAGLLCLGTGARAWTYGDWRAAVDIGAEGQVADCSAGTGGDGLPRLFVSMRPGDGTPRIWLEESAPRHYPTALKDGQAAEFSVDGTVLAGTPATAGLDDEGIMQARAEVPADVAEAVLPAMAAGSAIKVSTGGRLVAELPLRGFTAAYLKMAELCGRDGALIGR
ncbi:hypothetical protein [Poseidonocella sp. HB161398]|uniref:hypothetical protein n=1 Tax=Poseidonocella sp. HB161398 TaxID=2320855 RepID=UPI0011094ED7|nr:hypothetical protein [Poseidonocella sp. HB161398]